MTLAAVNVFPEPVTPRSVWKGTPDSKPWTSSSMACGWSPVGRKREVSLKDIDGAIEGI